MQSFEPHPWLRNRHVMTLVATVWPRRCSALPQATERLFEVEPGTRLRALCHWQAEPRRHATLVLVHGLEGSTESTYMLGVAEKAFVAGFNAVRLNQRNCGQSEHLTSTLYNSGLSGDYRAVLFELIGRDGLPEVFYAGYSMGGNLVLKMAGELGGSAPAELRGVVAVSPTLELALSVDALARRSNWFYQQHFVRNLKNRYRRKARLFPSLYRVDGLACIHTIREFDDVITAPFCGYRDAKDYYFRASARRVIGGIRVPTLLLTAQDDPFVPFEPFHDPAIAAHPHITLIAPPAGGHCAFLSRHRGEERYWAEARIIEFCRENSPLAAAREAM